MDFTALHHFYWVVCEGNFSKAAQKLRVAQPAISRAVMRLEENLGEALLIRHKRHVELTPAGNAVFLECQVIFGAIDRVGALGREKKSLVEGTLRIGTADLIAEHLLPKPIASLMTQYEKLYPFVSVGPSAILMKRIAMGELDLGLFFHVPSMGMDSLDIRRIATFPFRLLGQRKSLAKSKDVCDSFIGSRELDSPDTRTYPTLDKLRKKYKKASIRVSSNHLGFHRQLALLGLGVALVPEFALSGEDRRQLNDVLPKELFHFDLKLVTHKQRPLSQGAKEFIEVFSSGLGSFRKPD